MDTGKEIIYPDLSYQIIGASFRVYNELGWGLSEKDYQRALAKELAKIPLAFKREVYISSHYQTRTLTKYFADFIVAEKVLLELKITPRLGYIQAKQTLVYLKTDGIRLGILIYFTNDGVKYRRILNPKA